MLSLPLKIAYSAFVGVLVPTYVRQYGPGNFLWLSDIALLLGCAAIWLEHPLLASMQAIAVVVPDTLWTIDFLIRAVTGVRITGLTGYMWDTSIPKWIRALSLFHIWLPIVLVWMVWRLGYDPRALPLQVLVGAVLLTATYLLTDPKENINSVHRYGRIRGVFALLLSAVIFPLGFYLPAHLAFMWWMPPAAR